eukprot:3237028-Alexandrium_andersonii.AAC.1
MSAGVFFARWRKRFGLLASLPPDALSPAVCPVPKDGGLGLAETPAADRAPKSGTPGGETA